MFKKSILKKIISSTIVVTIITCIGIYTPSVRAEEMFEHSQKFISNSNIRYRNSNIVTNQNGNFAYLDIKVKANSDILNNAEYYQAYSEAVSNLHAMFSGAPVYTQDVSQSAPNTANIDIEFETDPNVLSYMNSMSINATTYLFDQNGVCVTPNKRYKMNGADTTVASIRKYYNCPTANLLIKVKSAKIFINKSIFDTYINPNKKSQLITHELGHALGLGHNGEYYSIMNPSNIKYDNPIYTIQHKDITDLTNMYKDFKLNDYSWDNNGWIQK